MEEKFIELAKDANLPMPTLENPDDTMFEYVVNEKGQWEHWAGRVCYCILWFNNSRLIWWIKV